LAALVAACHRDSVCGAPPGRPSRSASVGITRGAETIRAMALLDVHWASDAASSGVLLLGYPNLKVRDVAVAATPFEGDPSGLHRTYAAGGDPARCDGDLRSRLAGRPSPLTGAALAADLDAVVALARPTDVYTHVAFDGHPDHAEIARQVVAALERSRFAGVVHGTLMHPEGTGKCMGPSADEWPNPRIGPAGPFARFTPALDVEPPPVPPCTGSVDATSWGPDGVPDELVEVPPAMQATDPEANLKWRVIATYASQIDCTPDAAGRHHASCGYMRAFVKRREFFWTRRFGEQPPAPGGPVLVVAAHPDDEALGMAGVIARARADGRRVVVAVVSNGDSPLR
jgi:LmbE family N-acetylglucosaminyl deacetylase